jgi:hypothetical protein
MPHLIMFFSLSTDSEVFYSDSDNFDDELNESEDDAATEDEDNPNDENIVFAAATAGNIVTLSDI